MNIWFTALSFPVIVSYQVAALCLQNPIGRRIMYYGSLPFRVDENDKEKDE